jgi:E3 ubiquitin-protein ligase RNF14
MEDNPYKHFNDLKSTCYMRLWELEGGDGAEAGQGYAGGRAEWDADSDADSESEDELGAEDFADFAGIDDLVRFSDDEEDTSDEEPAPNQRRPGRAGPMQIELVNAAGQHIIHNIPERPQLAPARLNQRRQGRQQAPNHRAPPHHGRPPPAPQNIWRRLQDPQADQAPPAGAVGNPLERLPSGDEEDAIEPVMIRIAAAPGQGNEAAQQPAPVRAMGLDRFLELANNDQEDEWDSDELDGDIEAEPRARLRRDGRRY